MSKKKIDVLLVIAIIVSYFFSGAIFVGFFNSWSPTFILSSLTSLGVYFILRKLLKRNYPSTYEEVIIDENDERNMTLRYQSTYYGFFIGLVVLMIIGTLLFDSGYPQLQQGIMISMFILLITQVIGYVFVHYKNRS